MPGAIVFVQCEECPYSREFTVGAAVRWYDNVSDYMKDNRLRRVPEHLVADERIEMMTSVSMYHCPACSNLFTVTHRTAHDQSGHMDERFGNTHCRRCNTQGHEVDESENMAHYRCPNCLGLISTSPDGLWD